MSRRDDGACLTITSLVLPRMMKGSIGGGRRRLKTATYFGALEPDA